MPKVYNKQQANIVEQLKEKKVAVIVDETTDIMGRYVVNVLLQLLDAFADIPIRKARCNSNQALHDAFVRPAPDRWVSSSNEDFRVHKVHEWDHDAISVDGHPTQI